MFSNIRAKWWAVTFTLYYTLWLHLQTRCLLLSKRLLQRYWRNMKYYQWFKDCVDATEGAHVTTVVPMEKAIPYRSRQKNECTRNVMVLLTCDSRRYGLDGRSPPMAFIYLRKQQRGWYQLPSPEVRYAINHFTYFSSLSKLVIVVVTKSFVLTSKYYVADVGYLNTWGYLAPYRDCRYHL